MFVFFYDIMGTLTTVDTLIGSTLMMWCSTGRREEEEFPCLTISGLYNLSLNGHKFEFKIVSDMMAMWLHCVSPTRPYLMLS